MPTVSPPSVIAPVRWAGEALVLLDQTRLPGAEVERACTRWEEVAEAIRTLAVRGAPAIGVAAAFGIALAARQSAARTFDRLLEDLQAASRGLAATRPTARISRTNGPTAAAAVRTPMSCRLCALMRSVAWPATSRASVSGADATSPPVRSGEPRTRSIPQIGQVPGLSETICGCIGQ